MGPTWSDALQVTVPKSMSVLALKVRILFSPSTLKSDLGKSMESLEEFMLHRKSRGRPLLAEDEWY